MARQFASSGHLRDLIAEAERLATLVAEAPAHARRRVAAEQLKAATVASLRLDGVPPGEAADPAGLPYAGCRAALLADDLAEGLRTAPARTLAELHARATQGLLPPGRAGQVRQQVQAVQDGSVGRVIFRPTEPAAIPSELARIDAWLVDATEEHSLVVSGVLHHELLRIHPFDAANGRVARAAARLLLRTGGLDPDGLATPEPELARDPLGYHDEVARTLRRRDHTIWLERWGEAVADGLRASARALGALDVAVPDAAARFLAGLTDGTFTIVEHRAHDGSDPTQLQALLDAGRIRRVPGSRGLRFERRGE